MIAINSLTFRYPGHDALFKNMNLSLQAGSICGLLGKNGAGKSTLLKLLAGLLFPTAGSCTVQNAQPAKRLPSFLRDIYLVTEDVAVPALTPAQYVQFYAPFYPLFDTNQFQQFLHEFELTENKLLTTFSHGQKKKFMIAFALATGARFVIFDEPTNGLDIPSKTQFRKLLAASLTDEKCFIISTHQVHDVENLIDTIIVLQEGTIIFQENLHSIMQKLSFTRQTQQPALDQCLYLEKQLDGYQVITLNHDDTDSYVNLELLFNAILANQQKFQLIFKEA